MLSAGPSTAIRAGAGRARHLLAFATIAVVTIAARLPFLLRADRFFDSDEAVEGLMARHVLLGEFPAFLWGQRYKGVPEVYLSSAVFRAAGSERRRAQGRDARLLRRLSVPEFQTRRTRVLTPHRVDRDRVFHCRTAVARPVDAERQRGDRHDARRAASCCCWPSTGGAGLRLHARSSLPARRWAAASGSSSTSSITSSR